MIDFESIIFGISDSQTPVCHIIMLAESMRPLSSVVVTTDFESGTGGSVNGESLRSIQPAH